MKVAVHYQDQRVEIDVPESSLAGSWEGEPGLEGEACSGLIAEALDSSVDYPALRQTVVPEDRVVIALGREVSEASLVIGGILKVLNTSGVTADRIQLIADSDLSEISERKLSKIVTFRRHDPVDLETLAYLASTSEGRRIYLSRELVEADFVVTVGTVGYDPHLGFSGPWSALFPGLSNEETRAAFQSQILEEAPNPANPSLFLKESWEASWLLGSQFQVGVVPGVRGIERILTGLQSAFHDRCIAETERVWGFHPKSRAKLVIAGVGRPGQAAGIEEVARGLSTATRLVQRGGKIVLLSTAEGPLGYSVRRLIEAEVSGQRGSPLRGLEAEPDYAIASMIAKATAWADVYILSRLHSDDVDGLGMIRLEKPSEAARLASLSQSCLVLSQAERLGVKAIEESE